MPTHAEYAAQLAALDQPALLEECRKQHALDLSPCRGPMSLSLIACWEECRRRGVVDLYRAARTLAEQDRVREDREQAERVRACSAAEGGTPDA